MRSVETPAVELNKGSTSGRPQPRLWLIGGTLLLLGLFGGLKAGFNPNPVSFKYDDSGYYLQAARQVLEGNGLVTSISAYGQGFLEFPFTSAAYPLWPVVLAAGGALTGLESAASWAPELLYLVSLAMVVWLAFGLLRAFRTADDAGSPIAETSSMWLLASLLGANAIYFLFTSLPFTEGLAFCLLLGLPLLASAATRSVPWAAAAGLAAGLAYLARYQSIGVILAVPLAIAIAGPTRRPIQLRAAVALVAGLLVAGLWMGHLAAVYGNFSPRMLVDFTSFRASNVLESFDWIDWQGTPGDFLRDRISMLFWIAFSPSHEQSYIASFGFAAYLPLLAAAVALPGVVSRKWTRRPAGEIALVAGAIGVALACLGPVHAVHASRYLPYSFGVRHGLVLFLAIVPAACFLLGGGRKRALRLLTVALLIHGIGVGMIGVRRMVIAPPYPPVPAAVREFADWIERQPTPPVIVAVSAYALGGLTRANFHGISCDETPENMRRYFEVLGADYLATQVRTEHCPYFVETIDSFEAVGFFGDRRKATRPIRLWRWRGQPIGDRESDSTTPSPAASTSTRAGDTISMESR